MNNRLYDDLDFYVRVQKTKLVLVVVGLVVAVLLGKFEGLISW